YQLGHRGYRFFDQQTKKVIISHSASFAEHTRWHELDANHEVWVLIYTNGKTSSRLSPRLLEIKAGPQDMEDKPPDEPPEEGGEEVRSSSRDPEEPQLRRSERANLRKPPDRYQAQK
ncbi:hypothetical protein JRQ81_001993, partial [Phrynocephalus forsythii]